MPLILWALYIMQLPSPPHHYSRSFSYFTVTLCAASNLPSSTFPHLAVSFESDLYSRPLSPFPVTFSLCGAHALERVGEMKSQKIQKGGLFDSADEKDVLVKSLEQGWVLDHTPNIGGKKELTIHCALHNVLTVCKSNNILGLTSQNVLILVSGISYSISSSTCVLTKFWLGTVNLGERVGFQFLLWKGCFSEKSGARVGFRPNSTQWFCTALNSLSQLSSLCYFVLLPMYLCFITI